MGPGGKLLERSMGSSVWAVTQAGGVLGLGASSQKEVLGVGWRRVRARGTYRHLSVRLSLHPAERRPQTQWPASLAPLSSHTGISWDISDSEPCRVRIPETAPP